MFAADGTFTGYRGTSSDITERKRLEEQLRQAQKMEAVGLLTGGIAHDFNNILGIVMGNLQLLRRQLRDDPARMEFVEMALRGVRRGAEITNKLLGFSSWEGNETTSTSINEIFDQMKELLAKSLTAATTIKIDLADNLWPADINAGDFEDAIVNLALNARDAMPAGGTLLITTANKVLDDRHAARNPLAKAGFRDDLNGRHRNRDDCGGESQGVRTFLHDQGRW